MSLKTIGHGHGLAVRGHQDVADQRILDCLREQFAAFLGGLRQLCQVGFLVEIAVDALDMRYAEQAFEHGRRKGRASSSATTPCSTCSFLRRQQLRVFHDQQHHLLFTEGCLDLLVVGALRVVGHQHLVGRDPDPKLADLGLAARTGAEQQTDSQIHGRWENSNNQTLHTTGVLVWSVYDSSFLSARLSGLIAVAAGRADPLIYARAAPYGGITIENFGVFSHADGSTDK